MIVDLHNHTPLCNHAEGQLQDYILKAIEVGTKYFGFADHAPMNFDPTYRMKFSQMKKYEDEVLSLKDRFKDKIEILLGYEVDYIDGLVDKKVLEADVDYLIGSVHFIDRWGFDNPEFIGRYESEDIDEIWIKYFNAIEDMAKTGYFNIVGHLDLIKVFKFMPNRDILDLAKNSLKAIKEANMALELNVAGYRKPIAEAYPSKDLLKYAYELDIPITFASDAHKPSQVGLFSNEIISLAKDIGYTKAVYFKNKKMINIDFV